MNRKEELLDLFERYGYKLTLGQLLQHPAGYKATSRFSDLRKMGYQINFTPGKTPSENLYTLVHFDAKSGQGSLL